MNIQKYLALSLILSLNSALFCITKTVETEADFNKVLKSKKPQVIKFYADWCGACKSMKPEFEKAAADIKNSKVDFVMVQIDKKDAKGQEAFKAVTEKYNVQGIPTTIFVKNGEEVDRLRGCPAKSQCVDAINQKVDNLLGRQSAPQPTAQKSNKSQASK